MRVWAEGKCRRGRGTNTLERGGGEIGEELLLHHHGFGSFWEKRCWLSSFLLVFVGLERPRTQKKMPLGKNEWTHTTFSPRAIYNNGFGENVAKNMSCITILRVSCPWEKCPPPPPPRLKKIIQCSPLPLTTGKEARSLAKKDDDECSHRQTSFSETSKSCLDK